MLILCKPLKSGNMTRALHPCLQQIQHPCRAFCSAESSVPVLIQALGHEEYRVTICSLSTLCNLSASPRCLSWCASHAALLNALERVLMQKRMDPDPQANATQLLLNLCAQFCFKRPDDPVDDCTLAASKDTAATGWTQMSVKSNPTKDSEGTAYTASSRLTVRSHPTVVTGKGSHLSHTMMTTRDVDNTAETALSSPRPDPRALLAAALRMLHYAPALDKEARENCIEVVLALLQLPDSVSSPDPEV
jgi:hypothetical protein